MTTATIQSIEQINLNQREAIQSILIPSFKVNENGSNKEWLSSLEACVEDALTNKASLVELLYSVGQEGYNNSAYGVPNEPWVAQMVASDTWTNECQLMFANTWDGLYDTLSDAVNNVMDEFYPLS